MTMKSIKITFAILGGFAGFLIAGIFFWDGTGNKIRTASVGIAIGVTIALFAVSLLEIWKQEGMVLVKKFQKLNPIRGKHIDDVVRQIGGFTSKHPITITDRNNEQGQVYKFKDGKYEVEVLVGADGICIGILNELMDSKKIKQ